MSYIGSTPTSQAFAPGTDTFSGTGSQTAFTLSRNVATVNDILVVVNNVDQQPTAYTVSGSTLTFTAAPSSGTNNIYVRYLSTNLLTVAPQQGTVYPSSLSTQNALYWDTSGNVGVGTTSPGAKLDVSSTSGTALGISTSTSGLAINSNNLLNSGFVVQYASNLTSIGNNFNNPLALLTNNTERMRIDSSGNVAIGTSSVAGKLRVSAGDGNPIFVVNGSSYGVRIGSTAGVGGVIEGVDATGVTSYQPMYLGGSQVLFTTSGTERARIDSSGSLLVNTVNNQPGGASYPGQISIVSAGGSTKTGINIATQSSSASKMIEFQYTGFGVAGVITTTISSTAYTTSSDYRLKENVQPMVGALQKIAQLKPCSYTWKVDGSDGQGFIAHELQAVVPDCVVGEKDAINEDGSIKPQGIDTSFLVATLTAAIQEQQALITDLQTRLAALEAK